jgi:hypothetical protein
MLTSKKAREWCAVEKMADVGKKDGKLDAVGIRNEKWHGIPVSSIFSNRYRLRIDKGLKLRKNLSR